MNVGSSPPSNIGELRWLSGGETPVGVTSAVPSREASGSASAGPRAVGLRKYLDPIGKLKSDDVLILNEGF